jgi:O-acetyl-ADP-ribose deacetylase (regulator of RNase III)
MITYVSGSIFESPAQTLVNTVNTDGVMGRGLAADFKKLYPEMFEQYRQHCERGELAIGRLFFYRTEHKSVLNFPTKLHWRQPSRPEYIEEGLKTFVESYERVGIHSVAFPALGCGNGGLDFEKQVKPLMEKYLHRVVVPVFVYPHSKSPQLPEHADIKAMRRWLHTLPRELPFSEVWEDLRELLEREPEFETFTTQSKFTAMVQDEPAGLKIVRHGKSSLVPQEDLADLWQLLRTFGFVSNRSTPANRGKDASYIAPIFAALDYVQPVRIADDYSSPAHFDRDAEFALQFVPPSTDKSDRQLDFIAS